MKKKPSSHPFRATLLTLGAALVFFGASPTHATTAPDDFRERVVDKAGHCVPIFEKLSRASWPGRDYAEVAELQSDAQTKADYSLDMLKRYSAIYADFDLTGFLKTAETDINTMASTNDQLLDLAIFCEDELFKLIDEEKANDYTP